MRAADLSEGALRVVERPDPVPGRGEVLVRIRAAGVNNADLLQAQGRYPAPAGSPADIPGLELAGEVIETGPDAARFTCGDRVMAVVGGGGQAELAVVHERLAVRVPDGLGWDQAGGAPEAFTTAADALFAQAELAVGERLCVHGAAGGVGTAAVQLGAAAGATVVATVRHRALWGAVTALGAANVVAPETFDEHGPFDVVLELVGGANLDANLAALAPGGRIVVIGIGAGARADLHLGALMARQARIFGSTLRYRPLEGKAAAARLFERHVLPLLAAGTVHVPVAATFPLEGVRDAYERFAAGRKLGKIVVLP